MTEPPPNPPAGLTAGEWATAQALGLARHVLAGDERYLELVRQRSREPRDLAARRAAKPRVPLGQPHCVPCKAAEAARQAAAAGTLDTAGPIG